MKIKCIKIGVLILLILGISILYKLNQKLNDLISIYASNLKAFIDENLLIKDLNKAFLFTIDLLNYFNDSVIKEIKLVQKELKIKDNNLKSLLYLASLTLKKDTVIFRDTLFKEPSLKIDTILGDEWYTLKLGLKYPSLVIVEPVFNSTKIIIANYKKETINPPKKCWLLRLFLKKHKVVEVLIVEKNPYIKNKYQKFIEIIK